MTQSLIGSLRGLVMRAPGITATKAFYTENWGLGLAAEEPGLVWLRGTGDAAFLYGLKDDTTYGIEFIEFAMDDRAQVERLHAMGQWLRVNGAAIYGSRYWKVSDQKDEHLVFTTPY